MTATVASLAAATCCYERAGYGRRGLEHGDRVDIHTALPGSALTLEDITVVAYGIAPGTVGAYYPEANVLVPLNYLDEERHPFV